MSNSRDFHFRAGTRNAAALIVVGSLLSGCSSLPDFRAGERFSNPFSRPARTAPDTMTATAPEASAAETACMQAGRDAGFDVQGVVGTSEVIGTGGLPVSRDVMLRVQRGSQTVEVRCSFAYIDGTAQIMTL